ncbi:MAG: PD40 domain-containing protein [Chloroflexi bacterium]|nr:PD40 domain-containing protein [Chloroflexota bacterium]
MRKHLLAALSLLFVITAGVWIFRQLSPPTPKLQQVAYELVYMSDRDGDWDIYLLDGHGDLHNLTDASSAHEYFPGFSFDGDQIRMYSTASGELTTARVNVDGSDFKALTLQEAALDVLSGGRIDFDPVWNPGGRQMVWYRVVIGIPPKVDLFVADSDGTNRVRLTDSEDFEGLHSWSPDGSALVYVAPAAGGYQNTFVITLADRTITQLTHDAFDDYHPIYSLEGDQILVADATGFVNGALRMTLMNADGSDPHPLGDGEIFTGSLTFSPNGGDVAYMSNVSGYWHIYLMAADGSNVRQITSGAANHLYPSWRPIPLDE